MDNKLIKEIENTIRDLSIQSDAQRKRLREISDCGIYCLKRRKSSSGRWHYCAVDKTNSRQFYLGSEESEKVAAIKEYRYLNAALNNNRQNIAILSKAIKKLKASDYDYINSLLPATYQKAVIKDSCSVDEKARSWKERAEALKDRYDTYRPEELNISTDDGNHVRSKSEAMIYNYLLSAGVVFVYELPMKVRSGTIWPDFTLLSEQDYKTEIIIEHQGLMGDEFYRRRFADKVYKYIQEGYVQGNNIFFTFDSSNGGFDKTPIKDIVREKIKKK